MRHPLAIKMWNFS